MITEQRTGAARFAQALRARGVTTVFAVSGHQINSIFEALASADLRIVHMRHESAAAYAAAGWADATGEVGVALVCGGPGFLAALTGLSIAASMEVPMLLVSGGPGTDGDVVGAFQQVDQNAIARTICKASFHARSGEHAEAIVDQAFDAAKAWIPGPVHINFPIDVARGVVENVPVNGAAKVGAHASGVVDETSRAELTRLATALVAARNPVVIARPSAGRGVCGAALRELGSRLGVEPVVVECPRGTEDMKYMHVTHRYADSDLVLLIGSPDFSNHFLSPDRIASKGAVALIDAEGDGEPRRSVDYHVRIAPDAALGVLLEQLPAVQRIPWVSRPALSADEQDGATRLHPYSVATAIRDAAGPDDLIVLDGGDFCQWVRYALASLPNKMIWNSRFGAIGGAIPMAIGAAACGRYRRVFAIMGDGTFGYHGMEIETAVRENLGITVIVGNDFRWAAEWHAQRADYGRAVATMLTDARYDEVGRGLGARGYDVGDRPAFRTALGEALADGATSCINARIESVRSPALPDI